MHTLSPHTELGSKLAPRKLCIWYHLCPTYVTSRTLAPESNLSSKVCHCLDICSRGSLLFFFS